MTRRTACPPRPGELSDTSFYVAVLGILALLLVLFFVSRKETHMASEHVVELTDQNWQSEVVDSPVPVLVDFWAPWCGPCRQLTPTVNKIATQYAGKVKVAKLNVDDAQETAARYGITSIPRLYIFKGGEQPKKTIVGLVPEAEIVKQLNSVIDGQ